MLFRDWRFYFILFLCGAGLAGPLLAQLPLPTVPVFAHYHSGNSDLPADQIYKIHADHNGYLWLATDKGLVRYNGREFRLVKTGRVEDFVSSYLADNNRLWLFAYSGHTAGIDLNTHKIIPTDSIYGLNRLQDASKLLLVGIRRDSLLSLYGQNKYRVIRVRLDTRKSWSEVQSLDDAAWEMMGQYRIPADWQHKLHPGLVDIIRFNYYGLVIKDSFITIGNKIFKANPGKDATLYFNGDDFGVHAYLMGFARSGDDLYLGGIYGIGLCRIKNYFNRRPGTPAVPEPVLPAEAVTCIEKDYLGNIWVGTRDNGLFYFPYAEQGTFGYNKEHSGLYSDMITYVGRFAGGTTVLGYGDATAEFYLPGAVAKRYTLPLEKDVREVCHVERTDTRWLLFTRNGACWAYAREAALPGTFHLARRKEQRMDVGYKSGRLLDNIFYYISSNTFVELDTTGSISRSTMARFASPKRTCLLPLSDTEFYVGTIRGCYHNARLLPYLEDAQVNAIDTVAGQLVWATNIGVYALPLQAADDALRLKQLIPGPCTALKHDDSFTYLRYGDDLTLVDNRTLSVVARFSSRNYPKPFRLNDFYPEKDYLVLAGNQGLFYIPRRNLLPQTARLLPKAHVLCSLNDYAPADSVYTCVYEKGLSALFKLDILDYRPSQRLVSCKVLKDGAELFRDDDLAEDGTVSLRPTGPGRYQVLYEVKCGGTGCLRVLSYVLVVTPLWYQQWWCIPLLILLACVTFAWILYYVQNRRSRRQQQKLEQKIYLHELESQSLLGQLKPHFIFNILTPFQGYLMEGDKLKGLDYLDHFSGLMRSMLQSIRHRYTSLTAEIAFIDQYLQVQQVRFQHCFTFSIGISPGLDPENCMIPSLLLQPLVENAIEHGMIRNRNNGRIDIYFEAKEDTLVITVQDNGRGLPPDWKIKPDHALAIICERVQLLKKAKGKGFFELRNNEGGGTTATIILAKDNLI